MTVIEERLLARRKVRLFTSFWFNKSATNKDDSLSLPTFNEPSLKLTVGITENQPVSLPENYARTVL